MFFTRVGFVPSMKNVVDVCFFPMLTNNIRLCRLGVASEKKRRV